jgi:hypothetical protein
MARREPLQVMDAAHRAVSGPEHAFRQGRWRRSHPQIAVIFLATLTILGGGRNVRAQGGAVSEYEVKAAFLFHFAQFVEWPQQTFKNDGEPLVYCTVGDDPFHGGLEAALKGKTIGAHPLQVRHAKRAEDASGCQVIFLGENEKKLLPELLATFERNPVLVVGESEHFAQSGGTIGFCLEENKIRFEVNLDAAGKAKLKISSKLLALAKSVIGVQKGT